MAHKKDSASPEKTTGDLRFKTTDEPLDFNAKRFDIFLIDSGWNCPISKVVRSHLAAIFQFEKQDAFYILSPEQSVEIIRAAPRLMGHDPIILVYDHYAPTKHKTCGYRGFRLNLGLIKHPEQALKRLQEFLRFIAINRTAVPMDRAIRRELYREGFDGLVKILRETSTELI
jgi:hypothetical protein